jgi:chromosomal replication initiation ATPase DnaA
MKETEQEIKGSRFESHIDRATLDVVEVCGIDEGLILSPSRQEHVVVARFFLYTILRNSGFTWTHIGEMMNRDHGAVYMGYKRLQMRLLCGEKKLSWMRDNLQERGWIFKEHDPNDI